MSERELEQAVAQLPPQELARFSAWFEEFMAEAWDREIEADTRAGKLDSIIQQAEADFQAGRCLLV